MTTLTTERIHISSKTVHQVRSTQPSRGTRIILRTADGTDVELPDEVQAVLHQTLAALAERGRVSIGTTPEQLTSTVAADLLGVSRPTLMKLAREGAIPSFKVGSHTRFHRDDVIALRDSRERERIAAFEALRAFDEEHPELSD
ncbi:helix-turn-helix domain-containing protein [Luteococcus sp. Sow4_B9]|uniref:helix-turn-helix domain-containing protein n=1 Tax=Luteococcus sp. Sow4_B9 TaxID=3438792 RepID=UPI003F996894